MPRATTRDRQSKAVQYVPPNQLNLSKDVEDFFAQQGYKLRWVRHQLNGQDDVKNLVTKAKEGWELVKFDDLPEHLQGDFELGTSGRTEGVILNADVALAKIPVEMAEARSDYYRGMANAQEDAVNANLMQHSTRDMPIHQESRSRTTTGRKPAIGALTDNDD